MDTTCKRVKALCLYPRVYGDGQDTIFIPAYYYHLWTHHVYINMRSTQRNFVAYFEGNFTYMNVNQLLKSGKDLMPIGVTCVMDGTIGNTR
jgi:hypothetical protein